MKIFYDHKIFCKQERGGPSKYFLKLTQKLNQTNVNAKIFAGFHLNKFLKENSKKNNIGFEKKLYLGNINNVKDWSWAPEHVNLIYRIMQKNISGDFVIGTGKSVSIKYLLDYIFKIFKLNWKEFIVLDKRYIRANDINESRADISKIKIFLKWFPKFYVEDVVKKLILNEI